MTVARRCADRLESQPGVVGMLLYGSLASRNPQELTPQSDIDIALILDRALPAHFTEHRLLDGIKVDVLFFHASTLRDLVSRQPERLYQDGWSTQFLIRGLLLGSREALLSDPTGEIGRTKEALNMLTDYETMALPDARIWLMEVERDYLAPASEHLQEGNFREALGEAEAALRKLSSIVLLMACTKDLTSAAQKLGIPQFPVAAAELEAIATCGAASIQSYRRAVHDLGDHTFQQIFEPVRAELVRAGVAEPDALELTGTHRLFWSGNRLHELGRLMLDVKIFYTWSQLEWEQGHFCEARFKLTPGTARATVRRCEGLVRALNEVGYDVSPIVTPALEHATFRQLAAAVDHAYQATQPQQVSPGATERALAIARELHQIVTIGLASVKPDTAGHLGPTRADKLR